MSYKDIELKNSRTFIQKDKIFHAKIGCFFQAE